jgi:hypothetical protein
VKEIRKGSMIEKRGERTGAKEQQSNTSKSLIVVVGD